MPSPDDQLMLAGWQNLAHMGYVVPNMERAMKSWQSSGAQIVIVPKFDPLQNVTCALLVFADTVPIELVAAAKQGPQSAGKSPQKRRRT